MAIYNTGFRSNFTGYTQVDLVDLLVPRERFDNGGLFSWASSGTYSGTGSATSGDAISGTTWTSVDMGIFSLHAMAIKSDGSLWAWGTNNGSFGNNNATSSTTPVLVSSDPVWTEVVSGYAFSLLLKQDGTLWWAGYGNYSTQGQNGTDGGFFRSSPIQISHPMGKTWKTMSGTYGHVLAIDSEGALWSWGTDGFGQLGLNSAAALRRSRPTQVGTDKTWAKVSTNTFASYAIKTDGTMWHWGSYSQTGLNLASSRSSPVQVYGGGTWLDVAGHYDGGCGIKSDGTLWSWGTNNVGNAGWNEAGGSVYRYYPWQVGTDTNWKKLFKGSELPGAIKTDGTLWVWGGSRPGLGDGITNYSSPVQINIGGNTWKEAVCGGYGQFAIRYSSLPATRNNSGYLTASSTFTVPDGVTSITVVACGGGGGGGGGSSRQFGQFSGGAGGGSGEVRSVTTAVTPGQTITFEIGAAGTNGGARDGPYSGGSPGTAGGTSRASLNGGSTWFVVANGGQGGPVSTVTTNNPGGAGGSGGTGTVVRAGVAGSNGVWTPSGKAGHCEGGGGAAGITNYSAGLGTAGTGGIGVAYCDPCRYAVAATGYGAGGSGGGCNYASNDLYFNSTFGTAGFIYIYW